MTLRLTHTLYLLRHPLSWASRDLAAGGAISHDGSTQGPDPGNDPRESLEVPKTPRSSWGACEGTKSKWAVYTVCVVLRHDSQ